MPLVGDEPLVPELEVDVVLVRSTGGAADAVGAVPEDWLVVACGLALEVVCLANGSAYCSSPALCAYATEADAPRASAASSAAAVGKWRFTGVM